MKKDTSILLIFTFILLGFLGFSVKFIEAGVYDYGCTSAGPYNTITGQICAGSQYNTYNSSQYGVYNNSQYGSTNDFLNQQFSLGARGSDVLALQQMLTSAGFSVGVIDGIYGPKTDQAFLDYQIQYSNNNYSYSNQNPYSNQNTYPYYYNQTPVISGVNGPQTLNVNQIGTWTVMASSLNSGNLTYSVNWGDQPVYAYGTNNSSVLVSQQNAVFTHTYTQVGNYRPTFTVTNSNGQSASTSLSVVVGGSTGYLTPVIYSITPTYGSIGTQVSIYGTGFGYNGCTIYYCNNGNGVMTNNFNFGGSVIQNVYSSNGTSLTFTVPSNLNTCYTGQYCTQVYTPVVPGTYPVSVVNANGVSNTVYFTVSY